MLSFNWGPTGIHERVPTGQIGFHYMLSGAQTHKMLEAVRGVNWRIAHMLFSCTLAKINQNFGVDGGKQHDA